MRTWAILAVALPLLGCGFDTARPGRLASDAVIDAAQTAEPASWVTENGWNDPTEPFTIIDNIHYVGTRTVSAWLITGDAGHVLIDGVVPQSAPQIIGNITSLGFDITDVKFLLNSHAHIDHAGGLAGLQRASGATMAASAADKPFLEAGAVDHGPTKGAAFPPIRVDRVIGDGDTVRLGKLVLTAHLTAGHSPGCTSWSMPARGADGAAHKVFFHCSATVAGQSLVPESYPGMVAAFRATFDRLRGMDVDIFLANHENFFGLAEKRARQKAGDANAFVDAGEFARFNAQLEDQFNETLAAEQKAAARVIDLHYWPTPNGWKISIALEEMGLDYRVMPVNIGAGDQFQPDFLTISPNNRIPAIVDHDPSGDFGADGEAVSVFETGAILLYLAEKTGQFIPADPRGRVRVVEWLMWQIGGLGPMFGQDGHFKLYAPEKIPYAIARYDTECKRLLGVLDGQLAKTGDCVAGDYSIADMAIFPWVVTTKARDIDRAAFRHVDAWFTRLRARPAVDRGMALLKDLRGGGAQSDAKAREILFGIKP